MEMKTANKSFIIISVITILLVIIGFNAIAQQDSIAHYWLQKGGDIANQFRPQCWIIGIPNEAVIAAVTAAGSFIVGLIQRAKEKKRLRKQGKLND